MYLDYICPHCSKVITIGDGLAGQNVVCYHCCKYFFADIRPPIIYEDELLGILFDKHGLPMYVIQRTESGAPKKSHIIAQHQNGAVFVIQNAELKGLFRKYILFTVQDDHNRLLEMIPRDFKELKEGLLYSRIANRKQSEFDIMDTSLFQPKSIDELQSLLLSSAAHGLIAALQTPLFP
jgi:hypothetical protein